MINNNIKIFLILILCILIILEKNEPVALTDNIINLLLFLLASHVIFDFYISIKDSFPAINKIKIPIYLIVISLVITGPFTFIDTMYLGGQLSNSIIISIPLLIIILSYFIGIILLGRVLITTKQYKYTGIGVLISVFAFILFNIIYFINSQILYYWLGKFFNILFYISISLTYLKKNPHKLL
jgi:hypothetical protein